MKKKLLMIDPKFPTASKSVNHQSILPHGLLKIGAYYENLGWDVKLQRLIESDDPIEDFIPNKIIITSIFTYWAKYVKEAVDWAKEHYDAPIEVGGVFASLQPKLCKEYTGCDSVYVGVMEEVEDFIPKWDLLSFDVNYQIMHTSRGCMRRCKPCGVYLCEPKHSFISSIKDKVQKRKLVFYDNNLLANPYIENILRELILLKRQRKILHCEAQSGFDGRILRKKPHLAKMIYEAGFKYPKIAWDGSVKSWKKRKEEIEILVKAGFKRVDISVFVLINFEQDYSELELKRLWCWDWGVQVNQCRYRPLDALFDNYSGNKKKQTSKDYFIHPNWRDCEIRQYNRNVRRHNLSLRYRTKFYSAQIEYKNVSPHLRWDAKSMKYSEGYQIFDDCIDLAEYQKPMER